MKTKYWALLITLALMFNTSGFSQKCKADRLFTRYEYAKAIPYYEKVANKGGKQSVYAMQQLGDAYRLTSNFDEAAKWYSKAIEKGTSDNLVYFNYAQALRSLGRYDEAAELFRQYAELNPSDPRGDLFAKYSKEVKNWSEPEFDYEIINAEAINSPYSDFSPVYSKDGIVFTTDRMARSGEKRYGWTGAYYLDLFYTPLNKSVDGESSIPGSPSAYSAILNQPYHDGPATFSRDFNTMFFTRVVRKTGEIDSTRFYTNKLKIFSSVFDGEKWGDPKPFFLNNDSWSVGHPTLSDDNNTLYFVSDMPGGQGGTDIYSVQREGEGWGQPVNLGSNINTFGNEMFPYIHQDSILYFSSDGLAGLGSLDVFESVKGTAGWSTPQNLKAPVNSPADDFGYVVNKNNTEAMISSNRLGGKGDDDIYMITIKERLPDSVMIAGLVKDKESMEVLLNCTVFAWDTQTNLVQVLKTDALGKYNIKVVPGTHLIIKAMSNGFSPDCLSVDIESGTKVDQMNNEDLLLGKYKIDQIFRLENIYYDFDKWNIRPDAAVELDKIVSFLNENPDILVELGSHTDCRGKDKYNERLSNRRAVSAVEYIVSKGVNSSRITAKGYGENMLINHCADGVECSEQEHQENRRTEIKITGIAQQTELQVKQPLDIYKHDQVIELKDLSQDFFDICTGKSGDGSL